ncbi:SSI family serine proteinase inhibitor [Streptomyces inhibens]|uniref:SSI family serine proteinase inhibitor n=1 Tax=Streptomyces inhibens TaxID=2293571 RepID=UPI00379E9033
MPHRRTSSLFAAAATAVTAAVSVVSAPTVAAVSVPAVPVVSAASIVSAASAMALMTAPDASAAPIPLPHHLSADGGITGAGHHVPAGHHAPAGHRAPTGPGAPADHHGPADHGTPADNPVGLYAPTDHLTVTVRDSGAAHTDGTFELYCHPDGGNHHAPERACDKLDGMSRWGQDPFAPVPQGAKCTMMYGGPATAHVTGTWAGRPVNADFRRTNGCEISRWSRFEPLLPSTRS